jgi:hypothetical protein
MGRHFRIVARESWTGCGGLPRASGRRTTRRALVLLSSPRQAPSGRRQDFLQHVLALDEPLTRDVGAPTASDFSQVPNRDIDGRTQVDGEVGFTRDLMVAQPDNLGTQRGTPESPHKNAGARLINR